MLNLKEVPQENRNDLAFQMVVAMRDTINIAKKKGNSPTYENAIQLFHDFSPELYEDIITCLPQRNLSDDAKVYIAKADIISRSRASQVSPLEVLDEEIEEYKDLARNTDSSDQEHKKVLRNKIANLEKLRKSLKPRTLTEHRILARDISRADRKDFGAEFIDEEDFFVDYKLGDKKYLRIRMLHPDNAEHLTGADLIYEQHDEESGQIRILLIQYKIWDKGVLYFSQAKNLKSQVDKLDACLCQNSWCEQPATETGEKEFRFPYCAAFFRPTDKLQQQNEKLVSSGIHIPICKIKGFIERGNQKLERKQVRFETLNHEIFEQLFNRGLIGSRWAEQEAVEDFYKRFRILQSDESVIFYAREIREKKSDDSFAEEGL